MTKLFYYLLLKPLSLVPLRVLYLISNFVFACNYYLIGYRRKVVRQNIQQSFPNFEEDQIDRIEKTFFKFISDFVVESIKCFSISEEEALRRCNIKNPELLDDLYAKNKSIVLACGHYNNWEMAAACLCKSVKHKGAAIYKPLSNSFLNQKFLETRSKFGMNMIPKYEAKTFMQEHSNENYLIGFGCDQSPKKSNKNLFWTRFLNQDTAVMFGTEKYAVDFDYAVVFMRINRRGRGMYEAELELITETPREEEYGFISRKHTQLLEEQIKEEPSYWLWSHKRWKLQRQEGEMCYA